MYRVSDAGSVRFLLALVRDKGRSTNGASWDFVPLGRV